MPLSLRSTVEMKCFLSLTHYTILKGNFDILFISYFPTVKASITSNENLHLSTNSMFQKAIDQLEGYL